MTELNIQLPTNLPHGDTQQRHLLHLVLSANDDRGLPTLLRAAADILERRDLTDSLIDVIDYRTWVGDEGTSLVLDFYHRL